MSEHNGSDLSNRVTKLEQGINELKDALLVHAILESKAAQRIKEHAQFISDHALMMSEFDGKLNALIDIVRQQQSGSRPS